MRRFLPLMLTVAAPLLLGRAVRAEPALRHGMDERDLARVAEAAPAVAQLFAQGESSLERGDLPAAEVSFAQATRQAPTSGLIARRYCQVLTELGKRDAALAACKQAVIHGRTPMDERAAVGALMVGATSPTAAEVAEAVQLTRSVQRLSDQPFGAAALCEIAYRIGDDGMLNHCVDELRRVAPNHYETRRWAAVAKPPAAWPYWLGWGFLALVGAATGLHALLKQRPRRAQRAVVAAALLGLVTASARVSRAQALPAPATSMERIPANQPPADSGDVHWQLSTQFPINPSDPEASVPTAEARNKNPLQFGYYLQDLASEGAYAEKRNDPAKAVKYWRALAKAVPDVAVGFRKSCRAYEAMNEHEKALEFCAAAVNREGVMLEDYSHYGQLLLAKPSKLDPAEVADIEAVVQHLRDSKDGQPDAAWMAEHFTCEVGLRLNDAKRLERCTKALIKAGKNDQKVTFYVWSLAIANKNYPEARRRLAELKKTPMNPTVLARLQETTNAGDWWRKPFRDWRYAAAIGAFLLLAVAVIVWLRRRPKGGSSAPPSATPAAA